ncbi:MAG: chemotaxis response regulator protein-glutamate methylesterase, partial [Deltaproteobacteria bacterium]
MQRENVRILIVDDSALIRKYLKETLNTVPGIEVVGTASNGFFALEKIKELSPDVVTLDFHMPRLDGLQTLKKIMEENPLPVIMLSSVSTKGAKLTLEALRLGAVDFMPKPTGSLVDNLRFIKKELVPKIFSAKNSNVQRFPENREKKTQDICASTFEEVISESFEILAPTILESH